MEDKNCEVCEKPFKPKISGGHEKRHCSLACQQIDSSRRRYVQLKKSRNPEYIKNYMRGYYYRNKLKSQSRSIIGVLHTENRLNISPVSCKDCGTNENLKIKIEVFSTKIKEIQNLVKEGKIYYLCKKCEGKRRRKLFKPMEVSN